MRENFFVKPVFIVLSLTLFALALQAQEKKTSPTLERGIGQYKHENYDEALVTLEKAREEDPESTLGAYYLGLTYKQLQEYKKAVPHLRDAVTHRPRITGALIELIDCLYQLGELEEAKRRVAEGRSEGIRPAQIAFFEGLILLKEGRAHDAVAAFRNAKALDKSMTQACDYQIGLAHLKASEFDDAAKSFREVVLVDPSSNMANYANEYIGALARRGEAAKPVRLEFGFAWQYDDNVVLQPTDTTLVTGVTDKADSREVYTAQAEYNRRFNDRAGLKGQYFFYYAKQNDLGFYDTLTNTFALQPSLYHKQAMLTFPLAWSLSNVNDKFYLSTPSAAAVYNVMVDDANMAQAFVRYQNRDYIWPPSSDQEDRDGNELGGGVGWYLFFAKNKGFLNLKYGANRDWTAGNNWNYAGSRATAALLVPVLEKLNWTVSGDIFLQGFTRSHSTFNIYRKDQVYTLSTLVAYKFYKDSEIQVQYTFVKDDSNVGIYSYDRSITSLGVNLKF